MSFQFVGIDHVQLAAPKGCEVEARYFYGEVLGMKEIEKPTDLQGRGGCWFQCGNQEVHIGVQENFVPAKKAHPGFTVSNLEQLREKLNTLKIEVKEDAPIAGRIRFFVDDPFGNRIEFLEFK
ncbi:MAG: VOC family protein [Bacillaceae bacterium]